MTQLSIFIIRASICQKIFYFNLYVIGYVPTVFILQPICSLMLTSLFFDIQPRDYKRQSAQLERRCDADICYPFTRDAYWKNFGVNPGWEGRLLETIWHKSGLGGGGRLLDVFGVY